MALVDSSNAVMSLTHAGLYNHYVIKNTIDASKSVANGGVGTLLTTDTHKVLIFREGWVVDRVWVRLIQKGTIGATVITKMGDSVNDAVWVINNFAIGTGGTVGKTDGGTLNGYLYLDGDYILMTLGTANFDGILEVAAEVVNVFGKDSIS